MKKRHLQVLLFSASIPIRMQKFNGKNPWKPVYPTPRKKSPSPPDITPPALSSVLIKHYFIQFFLRLDALKQLNQSADPCTDFYEYACGGWKEEHALKPGETAVTGFSLVKDKSYNVLKEALANAKKNYSDVRALVLHNGERDLHTTGVLMTGLPSQMVCEFQCHENCLKKSKKCYERQTFNAV